MRVKKVWKWVLAAIILLIVAKLGMAIFGGFHGGHHVPRGFAHYGMRGHHIGGFPLILPFLTAVVWIAIIVMLAGWGWKKISSHRYSSSFTFEPLTSQVYPSYGHQDDFLDEWEKNQMNKKENA